MGQLASEELGFYYEKCVKNAELLGTARDYDTVKYQESFRFFSWKARVSEAKDSADRLMQI